MKNSTYCVIMAGGIGARFWPMSKSSHPKQFIDILDYGESLIQQTYNRFRKICPAENIYIVTNEAYEGLVKTQIPEMKPERLLLEPARRNTAPCIAYANYKILQRDPDANIIVAPSDHIILKEDLFLSNIQTAIEAASKNEWLITLGIRPSRPDTGYGYIQFEETTVYPENKLLRKVRTFTEKPDIELAKTFIKCGDFLWNSGIFIWNLKSIMNAFSRHLLEVDVIFKEGLGKYDTPSEQEFIRQAYMVCRNISIDYGVMEKADNVYVLSVDFGWSDLGTWGSLYETRRKDDNLNAVVGKNVMLYDTHGCVVNMPREKLVVLQGLEDYIVVEEENTLLICRKSDEQQLRQIVNDVKAEKGERFV